MPDGCYVHKYKIQLASGTGPIYTDYTTVPNDIMYFNQSVPSSQGSIGCQNSAQPEPACANFDFTNTWGPVCCNDYRVDFCCLPEGIQICSFLDDYRATAQGPEFFYLSNKIRFLEKAPMFLHPDQDAETFEPVFVMLLSIKSKYAFLQHLIQYTFLQQQTHCN